MKRKRTPTKFVPNKRRLRAQLDNSIAACNRILQQKVRASSQKDWAAKAAARLLGLEDPLELEEAPMDEDQLFCRCVRVAAPHWDLIDELRRGVSSDMATALVLALAALAYDAPVCWTEPAPWMMDACGSSWTRDEPLLLHLVLTRWDEVYPAIKELDDWPSMYAALHALEPRLGPEDRLDMVQQICSLVK